jgi:hypothetical protein
MGVGWNHDHGSEYADCAMIGRTRTPSSLRDCCVYTREAKSLGLELNDQLSS